MQRPGAGGFRKFEIVSAARPCGTKAGGSGAGTAISSVSSNTSPSGKGGRISSGSGRFIEAVQHRVDVVLVVGHRRRRRRRAAEAARGLAAAAPAFAAAACAAGIADGGMSFMTGALAAGAAAAGFSGFAGAAALAGFRRPAAWLRRRR